MASSWRHGPNELGYSACYYPNGRVVKSKIVEGTPTSVNVPVVPCPAPGELVIVHNHPGGILLPSKTDVQSGARVGAKALCILNDGGMRCFRRVK